MIQQAVSVGAGVVLVMNLRLAVACILSGTARFLATPVQIVSGYNKALICAGPAIYLAEARGSYRAGNSGAVKWLLSGDSGLKTGIFILGFE
jgi:hypothetical protein